MLERNRKAQHEARLPLISEWKSDVAQVPIQRAAVADGKPGLTLVGALDFGSMGVGFHGFRVMLRVRQDRALRGDHRDAAVGPRSRLLPPSLKPSGPEGRGPRPQRHLLTRRCVPIAHRVVRL